MKEESLNQTQSNKSGGIIMINVVRHGEICGDNGGDCSDQYGNVALDHDRTRAGSQCCQAQVPGGRGASVDTDTVDMV